MSVRCVDGFVRSYVGFCRHDFNIAVLKAFVSLSDFAGMILVQALRLVYVRLCTRLLFHSRTLHMVINFHMTAELLELE